MLGVLWRLARGYRLCPWRSPYLRWRIETYSGTHADSIGFRDFWSFVWRERRNLMRYARWARELSAIGYQSSASAAKAADDRLTRGDGI